MKYKIHYLLLTSMLFLPQAYCQDSTAPSETSELTEGPQTLPATSAAASDDTTTKTEAVPTSNDLIPTDEIGTNKVENLKPETEKTPKAPKPEVVSEEELLKPKKKNIDIDAQNKDQDKVKSKEVSESEVYIQEADRYKVTDIYKNLQLNDVIEQGLRKNFDQNIRGQKDSLNEIEFQGVKSAFWLPELKINLTTANQRISTLHSSTTPPTTPNPTTPTGSLGLSLGDYTVFNWGKDYALYLNKKSTFERNKQIFDESKRELKLNLIENYFNLITIKNIEKIRQDQLRQASFIYRLNKEKITVGKTSKQEYYLSRSEYLRAQSFYHESKLNSDVADENMSYLIADEIGTKYVLNETLDYRRIKIPLEESLKLGSVNNPTVLSDKTTLNNAERSYDVALKENMPLPKFSVNLGAYNKKFGATTNQTAYETYSGSGNVELVASINASWSLTGADGLFNSNKLAVSRIGKEIAFRELEKNKYFTQSFIRQTYKNILSLQNQIVVLEARIPSLQKSFDAILENYLAGKTKFYDFHLSLDELTSTKILYEQIKLDHLKEKLTLAKLSGLEDFPGENFEHLAVRIKGK